MYCTPTIDPNEPNLSLTTQVRELYSVEDDYSTCVEEMELQAFVHSASGKLLVENLKAVQV